MEHFKLFKRTVLEGCRRVGLTISIKKFRMGVEVTFAGYTISKDGMRPHPDRLKAVKEFPRPKDITTLRSFLGLVNTPD